MTLIRKSGDLEPECITCTFEKISPLIELITLICTDLKSES